LGHHRLKWWCNASGETPTSNMIVDAISSAAIALASSSTLTSAINIAKPHLGDFNTRFQQ